MNQFLWLIFLTLFTCIGVSIFAFSMVIPAVYCEKKSYWYKILLIGGVTLFWSFMLYYVLLPMIW